MVKDKQEIETILKSIRVNERTFNVIHSQRTGHQTEQEISFNLEYQMRQFGARYDDALACASLISPDRFCRLTSGFSLAEYRKVTSICDNLSPLAV